jgi:LmbE family N-acetylglucosaminyl deacetylase
VAGDEGSLRPVASLVCFHAHPDDESIATAGTMAKAAAAGHDVALVLATRGELGEPVPGVLADGEELWARRVIEVALSAEVLGATRVEFLDYHDSGMMGEPSNDDPRCFWQADVEQAAAELAAILTDVGCDVLTIYDDHGNYGHPDHIQVHRVGLRAGQLAGVPLVFQSTMNRDAILRAMRERAADFAAMEEQGRGPGIDENTDMGSPEAIITHAIDVTGFVGAKRRSMECHRSQIAPDDFFLAMPLEGFAQAFGTEWYIAQGVTRGPDAPFADDLFADPGASAP